jgi:hypothetical protein
MNNGHINDHEARARQEKIQAGKHYLEVWQRLRDQSFRDPSCVPTISRMAKELKISEERAEELRYYAFNHLAEDEMDFIRTYSSGLGLTL